MKLKEFIKAKLAIMRLAHQQRKTAAEVRKEMQEALDAAWSDAWTPGNIRAQVKWQKLFPGAQKPSVEEFIVCLAAELSETPK